jgi:site-specific recombinase XerD
MHPEEAAAMREQAVADVGKRSKHAEKSKEAVDAHLLKLAAERAGGADKVTVHDLRRTTGSWLAESGASLPLIGQVLNHRHVSTTAIYARLSQDPARAALEQHGERLMAMGVGRAG